MTSNGLTVDQRGFPRIAAGTVDIGAYEEGPGASIHGQKTVVTTKHYGGTRGVKDNYQTTNVESTTPSPGLAQWLANNSITTATYDSSLVNCATGRLVLESSIGNEGCHDSHRFAAQRGNLAKRHDRTGRARRQRATLAQWGVYIGAGNSSAGLLPNVWNTGNYSSVVRNIPVPAAVLAQMNATGTLDVRVQDDTAVDFIELCGHYEQTTPANNWTINLFDSAGHLVTSQQTMSIDVNNNNVIDPVTEVGLFWFDNLPAGTYTVTETMKPFWYNVVPGNATYTITVLPGQSVTNVDFVNRGGITVFHPCFLDLAQLYSGFQTQFSAAGVAPTVIEFDDVSGVMANDH